MFLESCSTELDDDSLFPDDSDEGHQELVQLDLQETSASLPSFYLDRNEQQETTSVDINDENDEDCDERRRLMYSDDDYESQNHYHKRTTGDIESYSGGNKFHASGSILLPSTTVSTTNRGADCSDESNNCRETNGTQKISPPYPYTSGSTVKMRTDTSYAVRSSGASIGSEFAPFPSPSKPHPRMGNF